MTIRHRTMYCSNWVTPPIKKKKKALKTPLKIPQKSKDNDCGPQSPTSQGERIRLYVEELFFKEGVDILISAHEHSYERTYPMYNYEPSQFNYIQPSSPIHIISGAAGCNEQHGLCINPIYESKGTWSAFRTMGFFHPYSYGHFRVISGEKGKSKNTTFFSDQVMVRRLFFKKIIGLTDMAHFFCTLFFVAYAQDRVECFK